MNAFHIAVKHGCLRVVEACLRIHPGILQETIINGKNVLHLVIESEEISGAKRMKMLKFLLKIPRGPWPYSQFPRLLVTLRCMLQPKKGILR